MREQASLAGYADIAEWSDCLGIALEELGDSIQARSELELPLRIEERMHDPGLPQLVESLNILGKVLRDLEDLPGARRAYECALQFDEQAHGPDHPGIVGILGRLAVLLADLADHAGAQAAYERVLRINAQSSVLDYREEVIVFLNLGLAVMAQGDWTSAYSRFIRVLRGVQAFDYRNDESLALYCLSRLARASGRLAEEVRLVIAAWLIKRDSANETTEQAWQRVVSLSNRLGYSEAQRATVVQEVAIAYQVDQGWSLIRAAFPDAPPER
jgi:tetratricopeptide (TPR) repeat protein